MNFKGIDPNLIRSYRLVKKAGQPSLCLLELRIQDSEVAKWLDLESLAISDSDDVPFFYGNCQSIKTVTRPGGSSAIIKAVAQPGTNVVKRFFQKPGKTVGDIVERVRIENCSLELDSSLKSKPYAPLLLQVESDFAFLRRLAGEFGRRLWVIDNRENSPALALKFCLDRSSKKFAAANIISLERIRDKGLNCLRLASREYCEFGRLAAIEGIDGKYLVTGLYAYPENGREVFLHDLECYEENDKSVESGIDGKTYVLPGKIDDTADPEKKGRVCFAVAEDYAEDDSEKSWLPWLSPYAGTVAGMVFVPEKNDPAELIVSAGQGAVRGALRTNALDAEAANVENKYLGNNSRQRIIWKKDCLELRSADTAIILKSDEILLDCAESRIRMGKDGIVIESCKDLKIKAQKELQETSGGKMVLEADAGIKMGDKNAETIIKGSIIKLN